MRKKLTEQEKAYRVRLANNKRLAKKALLDKPKWKPPKGKKYLMEANVDDSAYYLGKRQWANQTCVEVIKDE